MLVEIELLPWGLPHGVPSMPMNLKEVVIYPDLVFTILEVNTLTLHNLHYVVLALCKAARPAQIKEKSKFWCCNKALRLLSLWGKLIGVLDQDKIESNTINFRMYRSKKLFYEFYI